MEIERQRYGGDAFKGYTEGEILRDTAYIN